MEIIAIIFFVSIATFIVMGVDARRHYYTGHGLGRAATLPCAIIGSFGTLCGCLLWPMRSREYGAGRDNIVLIVSAIVTVATCLLFALID